MEDREDEESLDLLAAENLTEEMIDQFWDSQSQVFFNTGKFHKHLLVRTKSVNDNAIRDKIINFMYGYTFDVQEISGVTGFPVAKRDWIMGDIIHSEPRIIDYFDPSTSDLNYRFIAVGANDGLLHVFTDMEATINNVTYPEGSEVFAMVPQDLLRRLHEFGDADTHVFMVDGSSNLFRLWTGRSPGQELESSPGLPARYLPY